MDRSQWISLVIVILYILAEVLLAPGSPAPADQNDGVRTARGHRGAFVLFVGFACIWWPDVTGAVLLSARFGPLSDTLATAARVLGWVILAVAILMWLRIL